MKRPLVVLIILAVGITFIGESRRYTYGIAPQVAQVRGSVVHITKEGVCEGSGFVLNPTGIVATAKHVTDGTLGTYAITTDDGKEYPVKYVIEDREHDVAFLQLDLPPGVRLSAVRFADLRTVRVGDGVFIMGSPYGKINFNSVTLGILSARQRDLGDKVPYGWAVMFQSDATAAPGNSGGPVFNMRGEVIGVLVGGIDATINYSVPVAVFMYDMDTIRAALAMKRFEPSPAVDLQEEDSHSYEGNR